MKQLIGIFSATVLIATAAWALDLQAARAQGSVCEKGNGFIEKVSGGLEVSALVAQVNTARQAEYTRISKENGQPPEVVAQIAAGKITAAKCK